MSKEYLLPISVYNWPMHLQTNKKAFNQNLWSVTTFLVWPMVNGIYLEMSDQILSLVDKIKSCKQKKMTPIMLKKWHSQNISGNTLTVRWS